MFAFFLSRLYSILYLIIMLMHLDYPMKKSMGQQIPLHQKASPASLVGMPSTFYTLHYMVIHMKIP